MFVTSIHTIVGVTLPFEVLIYAVVSSNATVYYTHLYIQLHLQEPTGLRPGIYLLARMFEFAGSRYSNSSRGRTRRWPSSQGASLRLSQCRVPRSKPNSSRQVLHYITNHVNYLYTHNDCSRPWPYFRRDKFGKEKQTFQIIVRPVAHFRCPRTNNAFVSFVCCGCTKTAHLDTTVPLKEKYIVSKVRPTLTGQKPSIGGLSATCFSSVACLVTYHSRNIIFV